MTSPIDILDRLKRGHAGSGVGPLECKEAIDLIERLSAERDDCLKQNRAMVDQCAEEFERAEKMRRERDWLAADLWVQAKALETAARGVLKETQHVEG